MRSLISLRSLRSAEKKEEPKRLPLAVDRDSKFVYASGSDVMKTFKKYGFVPPSEVRTDFLFKKNREIQDE
jgi:hypothetical protein